MSGQHDVHAVGERRGGEADRFSEPLQGERVRPTGVGGGAQQRLGHRDHVGRQRGDSRAPLVGHGEEAIMSNDLVHQPEPLRGPGINVLAPQVIGERPLVAQASGQRSTGTDFREYLTIASERAVIVPRRR